MTECVLAIYSSSKKSCDLWQCVTVFREFKIFDEIHLFGVMFSSGIFKGNSSNKTKQSTCDIYYVDLIQKTKQFRLLCTYRQHTHSNSFIRGTVRSPQLCSAINLSYKTHCIFSIFEKSFVYDKCLHFRTVICTNFCNM